MPNDFYEIIVVSSDDPNGDKCNWIRTKSNVTLINADFRQGPRLKSLYYYENIGIKQAKYDYVLVMNDDMWFTPEFYNEFIKCNGYDVIYLATQLGNVQLGSRLAIIGKYKTPHDNDYKDLYLADFVVCKKSIYEDIGYLDENIDWYGIGPDLSICFGFKHLNVMHNDKLHIEHSISPEGRWSNSENPHTYQHYIKTKWRTFCNNNPGYDFQWE